MSKVHRFIGRYPLAQGTVRIDDADLAHQLRSVLKLERGEMILLGDGSGGEAYCKILQYDKHAVIVEGLSIGRNANELPGKTTLYCAILKADHFELAAQKATEVGITEIVPIVTKHTVKLNLKLDRVQKIVREAAEVAGRGIIPTVRDVMNLEQVLTEASRNDTNYFFHPQGTTFSAPPKSARHAGIWIGPEGGWHDDELALARDYGMQVTSLGGLVLRAETAVIVATYLVAHAMKS